MYKLFVLMFVQLLLVTLSSRITNRGQYVLQFCVSFMVGIMWCLTLHIVLTYLTNPWAYVIYAAGSACGAVTGIYVHKRWLPAKKDSKEW